LENRNRFEQYRKHPTKDPEGNVRISGRAGWSSFVWPGGVGACCAAQPELHGHHGAGLGAGRDGLRPGFGPALTAAQEIDPVDSGWLQLTSNAMNESWRDIDRHLTGVGASVLY